MRTLPTCLFACLVAFGCDDGGTAPQDSGDGGDDAATKPTELPAFADVGVYADDSPGGEGSIGLYVIDPRSVDGDPYASTLPDADFVPLPNIPVTTEYFRVLQLPPQDADWEANLDLYHTGCNVAG